MKIKIYNKKNSAKIKQLKKYLFLIININYFNEEKEASTVGKADFNSFFRRKWDAKMAGKEKMKKEEMLAHGRDDLWLYRVHQTSQLGSQSSPSLCCSVCCIYFPLACSF